MREDIVVSNLTVFLLAKTIFKEIVEVEWSQMLSLRNLSFNICSKFREISIFRESESSKEKEADRLVSTYVSSLVATSRYICLKLEEKTRF